MRQLANMARRLFKKKRERNSVQASYFERFHWSILNFWTQQTAEHAVPCSVAVMLHGLQCPQIQNWPMKTFKITSLHRVQSVHTCSSCSLLRCLCNLLQMIVSHFVFFVLASVFSMNRFTASNNLFGIFKPFIHAKERVCNYIDKSINFKMEFANQSFYVLRNPTKYSDFWA